MGTMGKKVDLDIEQLTTMQATGMTLTAIAAAVGVCPNTVRKYISPRPEHLRGRNLSAATRAERRNPQPAPPSWQPVAVPVPMWERDVAAKRMDLPEPRPIYRGESRLRAKLNARRQESEIAG